MSGILETFLIAMTPIGELRAAIPVALTVYKLNWLLALAAAVLGNLTPTVLLLLFLGPISTWLAGHSKIFAKFSNRLFERTRNRVEHSPSLRQMSELRRARGDRVAKRGWLALIPFVAIPLPITGAWTGSLIAFLFKIPFKKAFPAITLGVIIAGIIVTLATQAGIAVERYFGWLTLLLLALLIIIILVILKQRSCRRIS